MKKIIQKNLRELIIMLLIYFAITFIFSVAFKRNGFNSMSLVYVVVLILLKLINTIYACCKKNICKC